MVVCLALTTGCAHVETTPGPTLDARLPEARILFVGAHPDDETLVGPILAKACVAMNRPCRLVILTRGEGGACAKPGGCRPDLATVRGHEMSRAASAYSAELHHYDFANAPLPWSSFPTPDEAKEQWRHTQDPLEVLVAEIRDMKPTIVLTFDPISGFTGHPEHELAARLVLEAVVDAAKAASPELGEPHRVESVYEVLSAHWLARLFGRGDDSRPTEIYDSDTDCRPVRASCLELALEITRVHDSQAKDMGTVRRLGRLMRHVYLRRVDDPAAELDRVDREITP